MAVSVDPSKMFNSDIEILSTKNEWEVATALLDTQCWVGDWVSLRLVERLGMLSSISTKFVPPGVVDANGRSVTPCGVVDLKWKWHPQGTRVHVRQFYVLPSSDHLDVVFGAEYIESEGLLRLNEQAFLMLVQHKKSKKGDEVNAERAKKRQQEEKAALEQRRKQQKAGSEQGGSQQWESK
ncbi:hypothetical protein EKO27_g10244 [Xylaria grammica]|uniref:Uncharacterized protein n=1 Tax=Xylaria grammica TaxID=363999 RepID=A0A439CRR4_9PEZI|nr:hypothetical protein EKO27_g10244 [Xylaria grammica]